MRCLWNEVLPVLLSPIRRYTQKDIEYEEGRVLNRRSVSRRAPGRIPSSLGDHNLTRVSMASTGGIRERELHSDTCLEPDRSGRERFQRVATILGGLGASPRFGELRLGKA